MLSNLLSNAIKFTPPGGRIEVTVEPAKRARRRSASPIPGKAFRPSICRIFSTVFIACAGPANTASPEKGLGLGLSFVAWIARAHGGTVDVRANPEGHDVPHPAAAARSAGF